MRVIATFFLFLLAGAANAVLPPDPCQETILDSQINCTFTSTGGTATYVVSSTAQAIPDHPGFAWISMQMSLNGTPCNSNYGTEVLLENSTVVTGTCTFSVRSNEVLHLSALAVTHNASPDGITIDVQNIGFSPDFVLSVNKTGNGLVTSSDGKINCGFDCTENYLTTSATILLQASAATGSAFTGWGGACSGTAATCIVSVSAATTVVANFTGSPSYPLVVSRIGNGIVTSYDGGIVCGTDCAESYDIPSTVTLTAIASGGSPFTGWGGACSGAATTCTITVDSAKLVTATFGGQAVGTVVEFRNLVLDHYFITASASEASAIDAGSAGLGWTRTGNTFKAGGPAPACRFYGSVSPGPNSHFFTANPAECLFLKQLQATSPSLQPRWNFEGNDFMTTLPVNGGACTGDLAPVYRAYNNGLARHIDSNHRITTEFAGIQEVLARGWIYEGVVMCAPR